MAYLVEIDKQITGNLLAEKSLLKDNPTIFFNASSGSSNYDITDEFKLFNQALSFKTFFVQNVSSGLNAQFNLGDALEFTAKNDGTHTFSFFLKKGQINATPPYDINLSFKVIVNGSVVETFTKNVVLDNDYKLIRLSQSFELLENDEVNFSFAIARDSVGNPNPNITLYFTAFQVNYLDQTAYNLPMLDQTTGWQSRADTTNVIELTNDIDNLVVITGDINQNGGLVLLDSNSKITPIRLGDVLQVDFACTFLTPPGDNKNVVVKLIVDGVAYRSFTYPLTKGAGIEDEFSISWSLPCGQNLLDNGATIQINPMEIMDYKNRYISVTRTHKGI